MSQPFIGAGWAFPLHTDSSGGFALATGITEIEQAIRLILATAPGERPMRPEFGCGIHDLVFDPINEGTIGVMRFEVQTSLDRWEPRIDVHDVTVTTALEDDTALLIDVRYSVRDTNSPRNLVFPFYVIPADEGGDR